MSAIQNVELECESSRNELLTEQDLCRRMAKEGSDLLGKVQELTSGIVTRDLEKARRELQQEVREQTLESGTREILQEMASQ
eukprot:5771877-Amphidinium_carterae.1